MQFRQPSFDQARDPLAHVYLGSARNYDTYLRGEYGHNYMERRGEWDSHYHELRRAFEEAVSYVQDHGVPRKHMNIAIIGPGFNPVGKDIDSDIIRQDLQQIKTLVLMDFSTAVIRSALDDLMQQKVPHEKMLGMQFDVTNGLSTAYYSYIMQKFQAVQTEEQMSRVTEEIEKVEMEELAQILARIEMNPDLARNKPDYLLEGGENDSRQLNLTLDHGEKKLPIHLWFAPMVTNGTGANAEDIIWETYKSVTADETDGISDSGEFFPDRQKMFRRIFKLISGYNDQVNRMFITRLLSDNPDSVLFTVNDISTQFANEVGTLPRITNKLSDDLEVHNIHMRVDDKHSWVWKDEPEHSHEVKVIRFLKSKETAKEVGDSGVNLAQISGNQHQILRKDEPSDSDMEVPGHNAD